MRDGIELAGRVSQEQGGRRMTAARCVSWGLVVMMGTPIVAYAQVPGPNEQSFDRKLEASLTGFEENPTLSTPGRGEFTARITKDNEIVYELKYSDLESDITQSHIHFGRPGINGGIAAWLCGTPTNPGPATNPPPACELGTSGTVTGVITAANVIGPAGQGIAAGEFEELLAAIRAGATYANVHTTGRTGGEIRGVVR
jgi:hypothetical protein